MGWRIDKSVYAGSWRAGELAESIVARASLNSGSAGCQPAVFGSLAKHDFVGRLPTNAGKLPALPGQDRFGKTPKPTRETVALPRWDRPVRLSFGIRARLIFQNREGKLRHRLGQSQPRILGLNFAIAENIAQIRQTRW